MPKSRQRQRRTGRPYAPPPPRRKPRASPKWFGLVVLGLIGLGIALIVLNYMDVIPTHQYWLWVGLGLIAVGFAAATQWR